MDNKFQQISIEQLDSVSFGDIEFKKELIEIFLEQIPEFISNMNKFFAKNDWENLAKEAHTAKSSSLIFGMTSTGTSLKDIQLQAEKSILDQLPALLNKVESELKDAEKQLKDIQAEL
jgi:HPt (histidine-containing phosphotransfer) domain-containing protein